MGSTVRRGNRLLEGDGFVRFYRKHAQALLVFFARRVLEPELAHDLTAETFAQAFVSRRRFRGTTDTEAAGWLYGIARHELNRYLRRGYAERKAIERLGLSIEPLTVDERERIEDLADLASARRAIAEAVSGVSPGNREALSLRIVRQLPYPEVAAELEISEQAARARVSRGLRSLRDALNANATSTEELMP